MLILIMPFQARLIHKNTIGYQLPGTKIFKENALIANRYSSRL